jgi:hypothetical protein
MAVSKALSFHVYYHRPGGDKITFAAEYDNFDDAFEHAKTKIQLGQYVALIEDDTIPYVSRYLITPGCGDLACISMDGGGFNEKLSNVVNFVMASEELPTLPCEDDVQGEEELD